MRFLIFLLISISVTGSEKIAFEKVKAIFESKCLKCHSGTNAQANGNLNMETRAGMLKGGRSFGPGMYVGKGAASPIYTLTKLGEGKRTETKVMPPEPMKPIDKESQETIRQWIDEGAEWPEGVVLKYRLPKVVVLKPSEVYKKLFDSKSSYEFKDYSSKISGSEIEYSMVAVKGGSFQRGSKKSALTMPVREIAVDDFWMGKYEVTWEEYEAFLFRLFQEDSYAKINISPLVSHPTPPYVDMTFGMGKKQRPVICVTQLAAKAYCMWLSAKTGHFYRLPTEAEWEYACKAGSKTKYYWGDELADYKKHEWFYENSNETYQKVGRLKANPFGLHDMLGNVAEWCLDSYDEDFYKNSPGRNPLSLPLKGSDLNNPSEAVWPLKIYGRIVRGGSYNDDPEDVYPERRMLSVKEWKMQDPQLPKSVWWMTDSLHVGFRLVRSREVPVLEELYKYWPTDEEIKAVPVR